MEFASAADMVSNTATLSVLYQELTNNDVPVNAEIAFKFTLRGPITFVWTIEL